MNPPAIETVRLRREFAGPAGQPPRVALHDVDLRVAEGEVHGLLGPNGAGKSTLSKILSTVLTPTSGEARVLGWDVQRDSVEVRRTLALVLGGDRGLYGRLTARENLRFWADAYGMRPRRAAQRAVNNVLDQVGIAEVDTRVEQFSRGMKQRVHLARALLIRPRLLILDEPTMGLDPAAAHAFRDLVVETAALGTTILLTTHDLREAEAVCDAVTLIVDGRLRFTDSPDALRRSAAIGERIMVHDRAVEPVIPRLVALSGVSACQSLDTGGAVVLADDRATIADALKILLEHGISEFSVEQPTLEQVYLNAVGDRGMHVD